jgi:hypothetical protein
MTDPTKGGADKVPQNDKASDGKGAEPATAGAAPLAETKPETKPKTKRERYYVVGPGSVRFGGQTYAALDKVDLTAEEAASLGESVKPGAPPKAATDDIEKRTAGTYEVAGPGQVMFEGVARSKGFELKLDAVEARKLGTAVIPSG